MSTYVEPQIPQYRVQNLAGQETEGGIPYKYTSTVVIAWTMPKRPFDHYNSNSIGAYS